jgi:hypothetical protein
MVERYLVRAHGDAAAPLRHLDLEVLHEALSRLLSQEREDASLIVQLVVEGTEPALVAADRGVSRTLQVEQLRDAVDKLAMEYEDVAYAALAMRG